MALIFTFLTSVGQVKDRFAVIAYYAGNRPAQVDSFAAEKLTHIIFSFSHLKGNQLHINNQKDSAVIEKLVGLKQRNPSLKVLLSLGGWGGCETCSSVFSSAESRDSFATSVKELTSYFKTDGLDLDWEYPAIEGYPGHLYQPDDKPNFTALVSQLRKTMGKKFLLTFAAGGFKDYIDRSIEWKKVIAQIDLVNIMTYDLVNGFSKVTGHHTPLYNTSTQKESVDNAVSMLIKAGVPRRKLVIGAAFYGRMWEEVAIENNGLYQAGNFKAGIPYRLFSSQLSPDSGFIYRWDEVAQAPYIYHPEQKLFITYDDKRSVALKAKYVKKKKLGGIMFWQLTEDTYEEGLLSAIDHEQGK
jgi:chitinase